MRVVSIDQLVIFLEDIPLSGYTMDMLGSVMLAEQVEYAIVAETNAIIIWIDMSLKINKQINFTRLMLLEE